ncbi:DCC1-like thiol-disulfide oxidoreductase family protein, partial [Pseudacidovorax intermedius]
MNPDVYPLTLYYDASCPMCDAEMTHLRLRDEAGRLAFVDASAPGFDAPP